jgi:nitroreductase
MKYEQLLELVKSRRSIRRFKPDPIPDEYIDKIIDAAHWAPSGFNQQPWEFVVIKNPELKKQISNYCKEQLLLGHKMNAAADPSIKVPASIHAMDTEGGDFSVAPVFIALLGDHRTIQLMPSSTQYGTEYLNNTFNSGLTCSFLYMHLAATTLGLAAQWVSAVQAPYVSFMVKELLGIPKYLSIYDMMALGYPGAEPKPRMVRAVNQMVHHDYCGPNAFRSDENVLEYIKQTRGAVEA